MSADCLHFLFFFKKKGGDPRFRRSASPERSYPKGLDRNQRARSHDRVLHPQEEFGLARYIPKFIYIYLSIKSAFYV